MDVVMNKKTAIAAVAALLVSACEAVCPAYDNGDHHLHTEVY